MMTHCLGSELLPGLEKCLATVRYVESLPGSLVIVFGLFWLQLSLLFQDRSFGIH